MYCQQTVPVNGSICPSEYATLRALLGNGNTSAAAAKQLARPSRWQGSPPKDVLTSITSDT
eukprot:1891481-Amphidinium_carterae.1